MAPCTLQHYTLQHCHKSSGAADVQFLQLIAAPATALIVLCCTQATSRSTVLGEG